MIFGIAGRNGAGKSEVVRLLSEHGFEEHSLSDVLRDVLCERGLAETRERMIEAGRELRREDGPGALALRVLERLDPERDYAIDSIRHPAEVEALRAGPHAFRLLWVDADEELRFERIRARGRAGDPDSSAELRRLETRELESRDPAGQQLLAVKALADHEIRNDGDRSALSDVVDSLLRETGEDGARAKNVSRTGQKRPRKGSR